MTTLQEMFVEPTAHHICDSGSIYGRAYQRNQKRDLAHEPQATLTAKWGGEVSVNTLQHLEACLEQDEICIDFNKLPCDTWTGEKAYGLSAEQEFWLEDRGFDFKDSWNSYNWENNFDQVLQGTNLDLDGEAYVLLQVHGGCDVRSGYTDARLFKVYDQDYFLDDSCRFDLDRTLAEAAGYPHYEGEWDWITIDVRGWVGHAEIYDPNTTDMVEIPKDFFDNLPEDLVIEGVQNAIEH